MKNLLDSLECSYLILQQSKGVNDFEIIKSKLWGQFNACGIIGAIYPELLQYKELWEGIVTVSKTGKTIKIQNYKFNDSYIVNTFNVTIITSSGEIIVMINKADVHEINGVALTANQVIEMRQTFTASIGHEIRTPLTGIMSMIELLGKTELSPQQKNFISYLEQSSTQLLAIINDILDYNKLETRQMKMEHKQVNLRKCIEESIAIVEADFKNVPISYDIAVVTDTPLNVIGDKSKIMQILINLIKNAVKFSPDNERVTIRLHAEQPKTSNNRQKFVFDIVDKGIGISPDDMNKLFIPYSQLDGGGRRKYGGTGLGLVLSKGLCSLMGGNITIKSVPNKGSTFTFTLILELMADATAPQREVQSADFMRLVNNKKIIIVDDDENNRGAFRRIFHKWNIMPTICSSAKEVLDWLTVDSSYDLAILDFYMPLMNGKELAIAIRDRGYKFPIILWSSLRDVVDGPFDIILSKPVSEDKLRDAMKVILTHGTTPKAFSRKQNLLKILVVEDYEVNQVAIRESLHIIGYTNVDTASNGQEAVNLVKKSMANSTDYDIILMDIIMPVKDGVEASKDIHRLYGAGKQPRIIALTANAMPEDETKYLTEEFGKMDGYMAKPISIDKLTKLLA